MNPNVEQLSCQELVELITDYLEGALPDDELVRFEEHLARCDGCAAYVEQLRMTIELVGALTPAALSPDAEQALLSAFRDWKAR